MASAGEGEMIGRALMTMQEPKPQRRLKSMTRCMVGSSDIASAVLGLAMHHRTQSPAPHPRLSHHRQPSDTDASRTGSRTRATVRGRSANRAACWIMGSLYVGG